MANSAQDTLFEMFFEIATDQASNLSAIVNTGEDLAASLSEVVTEINQTADAITRPASTGLGSPIVSPAAKQDDDDGGLLDALGSIASAVGRNALGAAPLIRGILSLFGFGGDDPPASQSFTKFSLPPSIAFLAADAPEGFRAADFDQNGSIRARNPDASVPMAGALVAPRGATTAPQVTVNVQAMDARSFLDRSDDIAAAVRNAMLNLNSLNDVVSDL